MTKKLMSKLLVSVIVTLLLSMFGCFYAYAEGDVPGELYIYENAPVCNCGKKHMNDESEYEEVQLDSEMNIEATAVAEDVELPVSVDLSEDIYFPRIGYQLTNSCSAWATTYYQFTYEVARLNNWDAKNNMNNVFSPKFVYNYLNQNKDEGVFISECYNLLKNNGAVRWTEYPATDMELGYYQADTHEETVSNLRKALETRVESYSTANRFYSGSVTGPVITSYNDSNLNAMKSLLNEGHPLVFTTYIFCHYYVTLGNGEFLCIYQRITEDDIENNRDIPHAMTIVGYDDSIHYDLNGDNIIQDYEKGAFKVANSWGENWGNDGYMWISYEALNRYSNIESLSFDDRSEIIQYNYYGKINVSNYNPQLTAEVTLNLKNRRSLNLKISSKKYDEDINMWKLYFRGDSVDANCSGGSDYESYTFLLDFNLTMEENEIYTHNSHNYEIWVEDISDDGNFINIEKIKWVDNEGNVFKEVTNAGSIDGNDMTFNSVIEIDSLSFSETTKELYLNETLQLQPNILPTNATKKDLIWTSSNIAVATVDSEGNITYVGEGETTITATTTDGTNLSASCTITTYDDFADDKDRAKQVNVHSTTRGEIETSYDVDYFKFVAPRSDKYVFNTEGYTDTVVYVYNSNNSVIGYNDDYSEEGYYNFAVACDLVQGETYYIKVIAYGTDVGEYDFVAREVHDQWLYCDVISSLNKVVIESSFAAIFDKVDIQIGNSVYTINLPDDYSDVNFTVDGIEFSANFSRSSSGLYVSWDIEAYFPDTYTGLTENIICTFSKEDLSVIIDMSNY